MRDIFDNVVCAVDDSEAGTLAARIAARVADPEGVLTLVSVENTKIAVHAGYQMAAVATHLAGEAREALERGREAAEREHGLESRLRRGEPLDELFEEVERRDAGLIVVGTHEYGRKTGIVLGSVATHMLHEAPCSVSSPALRGISSAGLARSWSGWTGALKAPWQRASRGSSDSASAPRSGSSPRQAGTSTSTWRGESQPTSPSGQTR